MKILRLWFALDVPVTRRSYVVSGFFLAALKFALDNAIAFAGTGRFWHPFAYLSPSITLRLGLGAESSPMWVHATLAIAALPFLWIGLSMSIRRAVNAGIRPLLGFGFLCPGINYLTIAILSIARSNPRYVDKPRSLGDTPYRSGPGTEPVREEVAPEGQTLDALSAVVAATVFGALVTIFAVYAVDSYGASLFFVAPAGIGVIVTVLFNRRRTHSLGSTLLLCVAAVATTGTALLLFAVEGILCITMAAPIAMIAAVMSGTASYFFVARTDRRLPPALTSGLIFVLVPGLAAGESLVVEPTLREAITTIEIDAPPEEVWPNVVGFSELPPPPEWFFRLGIAYPMRARIDGEGPGAIRYCEFSTGPFVEPITRWEPPRRLAFDVADQPPSMTEWSPYHGLNAPHLEGYMVSKGGEFRLVPIDGGRRTRLEGSTFYTLSIYPETYWVVPAELLLHAIHHRVLTHIKHLSEAPRVAAR